MSREMYRTVVDDPFPTEMAITLGSGRDAMTLRYEKVTWSLDGATRGLRYGENPDQPAAMYRPVAGFLAVAGACDVRPGEGLVTTAELVQSGKHPSKTNLTDIDSALGVLRYLSESAAAVVTKHNNPSGVAVTDALETSVLRALEADQIAAFGGSLAVNRSIDRATAEIVADHYFEVVAAPDFDPAAIDVLQRRKNLRIVRIPAIDRLHQFAAMPVIEWRALIDGGMIAQRAFVPRDLGLSPMPPAQSDGAVVNRAPTVQEQRDIRFGWFVEAGVTSNSVLFVRDEVTLGIGTGEQDRVGVAESARTKALRNAADRRARRELGAGLLELDDPIRRELLAEVAERDEVLRGACMVSDAFFPFPDGALVGLSAGVASIVQPGGALRDADVIAAVNSFDATMVFTGQRSFRH